MNNDMKLYYDYTVSPLGKLFYETLWYQLKDVKDKNILDFGSGFGFTGNYLAEKNIVTGLEIDKSMIDTFSEKCNFNLVHGGLEYLKTISDNSFDFISCHLVLEFVENPKEILLELMRVLKDNGELSIVRHNREGRIVQAIVQDYDLKEAEKLLEGGYSYSSAFGDIKYYTDEKLLEICEDRLEIKSVEGIRCLASLHTEDVKRKENWNKDMLEIELKLCKNKDFIKLAYFNHLILKKK